MKDNVERVQFIGRICEHHYEKVRMKGFLFTRDRLVCKKCGKKL